MEPNGAPVLPGMPAPHANKTAVHDYGMHQYDKLILLAEMDEDELCLDKMQNAHDALETVLRYGSCHDKAVAIGYFIDCYMAMK